MMPSVMTEEGGGELYIKENVRPAPPLSAAWVAAALAALLAALLLVVHIDAALPAPRARLHAAPTDFIAENAHEHLVNLTAIGPRVAGSYENEVLGVGVAVAALRRIARGLAPHHRLEAEVFRGSGAFPLAFLDGMNHVYRDVAAVVARLSAAPAARARPALLLNCHLDTVPDSPGASDDAAGCAVVLETLRALGAARAPHAHDVVAVLNAGEENVLQASHAFVTAHRWARSARVFLNLEACGAGGREVMFQAGPHDAWLVAEYAAHAPHPFASSLAQDLFRTGLIPADTDFRIYRDHGGLSGVDLAWSSNGYVYHTALDTAGGVPAAALQRTGDNVLALSRALLAGPHLARPQDTAQPLPVYFDVLGLCVVSLGARAAALGAAALLLAALLAVRAEAHRARAALGLRGAAWAGAAARGALAAAAAALGGAAGAAAAGLALHALGAPLSWYARPWLAGCVFVPAALGCGAAAGRAAAPRVAGGGRGAWGARALASGATLAAALVTALAAALGLRSGFVPALWAASGAAALLGGGGSARAWAARWAACAAPAALQTAYLAVGFLRMLIPVMGRAGPTLGPLPPDVVMGAAVGSLAVGVCGWVWPLWACSARRGAWLRAAGGAAAAAGVAALLVSPYSAAAPQRLMVFHVRRTVHAAPLAPPAAPPAAPRVEHFYWVPELDANTHRTFHKYFAGGARVSGAECAAWLYCGLPYFLPVRRLLPASLRAPAPPPPPAAPRLRPALAPRRLNASAWAVRLHLAPGHHHAVLIVRLRAGGRLVKVEGAGEHAPLEAAAERGERTYFYLAFDARARPWSLELQLAWEARAPPRGRLGQLSLAAHALSGAGKLSPELQDALRRLPRHVAAAAWTLDHHLYTL